MPPDAGAHGPMAIPGWFSAACETVEQTTGETIDRPLTWIRYSGHRAGTSKATGQADAAYWLASVVVAEHKRERRLAAERASRPAYGRQAPPEKPRPTQAELDRQRADLVARVRAVVQEHAPSSGEDAPGTRFESPGDPGSHQWGPGPSTGILARSLKGAKRPAGGDP